MEHFEQSPASSHASPPIARAVAVAEPVSPLTEAHFAFIRSALQSRRPVRRAARVAHNSAMSILAAGLLAVPFTLFSLTLYNVISTAAICTIGYLELLGARKMARGLPEASSHLGWNQVIFICLIVLYCIDAMFSAASGSTLSPQLRSQLSQVGDIGTQLDSAMSVVSYVVYSVVILLSTTLQGALAWYYFTRRKHLEAFQQATPAWVRRLIDELEA